MVVEEEETLETPVFDIDLDSLESKEHVYRTNSNLVDWQTPNDVQLYSDGPTR